MGSSLSKWAVFKAQPPISTLGQQGGMILPVGLGIGATQVGWEVRSPARAAGWPPIRTVKDPLAITPGPAGVQGTNVQGLVTSVTRAAGLDPINTFGCPLTIGSGRAGWGAGVGTGAAGWIGAWQCGTLWSTLSPILAAGCPMLFAYW